MYGRLLVLDGTVDEVRAAIEGIEKELGYRLHYSELRSRKRLRIAHVTKAEGVLCIADLLAGARTDDLCAADRELYALLAHRVRAIRRAFEQDCLGGASPAPVR